MGLTVTFVSGPRRSGKSAVIQAMIEHLFKREPHYLRLVENNSDKKPPKSRACDQQKNNCRVASARWLDYCNERIFEVLPEALTQIHKQDRYGSVLIEADADPNLRCAYPYDHRVFVMPTPTSVNDVFRDPAEAARELRRVLDDTAAFASEIFGMFTPAGDDSDSHEYRAQLTPSLARGFLRSPLGDELATRIQLQPAYHGLVESDLVILNTSTGESTGETIECVRRIEHLLARVQKKAETRAQLFHCNPVEMGTPPGRLLLKALKPICDGVK